MFYRSLFALLAILLSVLIRYTDSNLILIDILRLTPLSAIYQLYHDGQF